MTTKQKVVTGLAVAGAGAGAYFLFSKRFAPTRQRLAQNLRERAKSLRDSTSTMAGRLRQNTKAALKDLAQVSESAAKSL